MRRREGGRGRREGGRGRKGGREKEERREEERERGRRGGGGGGGSQAPPHLKTQYTIHILIPRPPPYFYSKLKSKNGGGLRMSLRVTSSPIFGVNAKCIQSEGILHGGVLQLNMQCSRITVLQLWIMLTTLVASRLQYSGTPLQWTPLEANILSLILRCS